LQYGTLSTLKEKVVNALAVLTAVNAVRITDVAILKIRSIKITQVLKLTLGLFFYGSIINVGVTN